MIRMYSGHKYQHVLDSSPLWRDCRTLGRDGKGPMFHPVWQGKAGTCGSCALAVAMSITHENLHGQKFMGPDKPFLASIQHGVDCGYDQLNPFQEDPYGVRPAVMVDLLTFARMNGFHHQDDYHAYSFKREGCEQSTSPHTRLHVVAHDWLTDENENGVTDALDQGHAVVASIKATYKFMRLGRDQVYSEVLPPDAQPDHVVVIVGYGEWNGEKYFLVVNSWHDELILLEGDVKPIIWGADGYGMVAPNMLTEFHAIRDTKLVKYNDQETNVDAD